jgi:16S rRNA processing protein RimM
VVARAHGIRGEIVVALHDAESTAFDSAKEVWLDGVAYAVTGARHGNHGPLVALEGVTDRNAAEALRGKKIEVARSVVADDDDVLLHDLVGCEVRLPDGTSWGKVVAIEIGPQDRLVIHHGDVERLLPVVDELIELIDLDERTIHATPPDEWPTSTIRR